MQVFRVLRLTRQASYSGCCGFRQGAALDVAGQRGEVAEPIVIKPNAAPLDPGLAELPAIASRHIRWAWKILETAVGHTH